MAAPPAQDGSSKPLALITPSMCPDILILVLENPFSSGYTGPAKPSLNVAANPSQHLDIKQAGPDHREPGEVRLFARSQNSEQMGEIMTANEQIGRWSWK